MNYLAHIFLSGDNEDVIIGNFIGDYVKGFEFSKYSEFVKKGIILHRHIDTYTDKNMIVRLSKSRIVSRYRKYSGIIIDIFYDHFLILLWNEFSYCPLDEFVERTHGILEKHFDVLPEGIRFFLPSFIRTNWIQKYATIEGLREILTRMSSRTTLPDETDYAIHTLTTEYDKFRTEFQTFFPSLMSYVSKTFGIQLGPDLSQKIAY